MEEMFINHAMAALILAHLLKEAYVRYNGMAHTPILNVLNTILLAHLPDYLADGRIMNVRDLRK